MPRILFILSIIFAGQLTPLLLRRNKLKKSLRSAELHNTPDAFLHT